LTQGGEAVHDEIENSEIIENFFHPSSYLVFNEDNSSNQISHDISPIHLYFNVLSEEPLHLRNLVVEVEKYGKICDRDGCYPMSRNHTEINNSSYPQTMHDLVQDSKLDSTILECYGSFQVVKALQIPFMVMQGSHDFGKIYELNHIWFLSHNSFICMV